MKKLIYFLLSIIIVVFLIVVILKTDTNGNSSSTGYNVIAHFDQNVISGNTLKTLTKDIQSQKIKSIFREYNIPYCKAVFKNRYNSQGFLNINPINGRKSRKFMEGWQIISIKERPKAEEIVKLLLREKGVNEVYIEIPLFVVPDASPDDEYMGMTINGILIPFISPMLTLTQKLPGKSIKVEMMS